MVLYFIALGILVLAPFAFVASVVKSKLMPLTARVTNTALVAHKKRYYRKSELIWATVGSVTILVFIFAPIWMVVANELYEDRLMLVPLIALLVLTLFCALRALYKRRGARRYLRFYKEVERDMDIARSSLS